MHLPVYENLIGRSEAFIHFLYPKLLEMTGDTLRDVSERELYEAINMAVPGLIRMEADELTYCLHIMIRYELEKAFVNGEITVDEIPALWNQKYKEYLGVDVPNDTKGLACRMFTGLVLMDISPLLCTRQRLRCADSSYHAERF